MKNCKICNNIAVLRRYIFRNGSHHFYWHCTACDQMAQNGWIPHAAVNTWLEAGRVRSRSGQVAMNHDDIPIGKSNMEATT